MKYILAAAILILSATLLLKAPKTEIINKGNVVAYRGGGLALDYKKIDKNGCSASSVLSENDDHIENTLEAVAASIQSGVDIVHLNIRNTLDGELVVFHDGFLDCATNGTGNVDSVTTNAIRGLDAGYGYTHNNGESFKWRGKHYSIPLLKDVLEKFPDKKYWFNLKSNDIQYVKKLVGYFPDPNINNPLYIVSENVFDKAREAYPDRVFITVSSVKRCLLDYMLTGWSRLYPDSCKNTVILVPPGKADILWGWPKGFASRAQHHGSDVYLWLKNNRFEQRFDKLADGIGIVIGDVKSIR